VAGAGIFDALAYIKTVGIIHRDVKPANVLIVVRGRQLDKVLHPVQAVQLDKVLLADFGEAKALTRTLTKNTVAGTPVYMAPA
jgi:serine/threonine protein kinase